MSGPARLRWRLPPNTISAPPISPRAVAVSPSMPSSPIPTMDSQRGDAALSVGDGSGNGTLEDMARVLILGRTTSPVPHAVPLRVGGFGGADGLADYIAKERVDALIDATHPYAIMISEN